MNTTPIITRLAILFFALITCNLLHGQITDTDSTGLEKNVVIIQYDHLPTDLKVNEILVAKGNNIWAATNKGAYHLYASSSTPYITDQYTQSITEGRSGDIWAGGYATLYNVNNGTAHKLPDASAKISDLAYQGGKVWIASDKGIFTYNATADKFRHYTDRNSKLKDQRVNFIQVDDEDVLWAGTANGYIRIKEGDWDAEDKGYDVVISRHNKEGQWMVATDDMWLINKFNRKFPVGLDESLYRGTLNDFVIDSKGRLYMASNILVRYDPKIERSEPYGAEVGYLAKNTLSLACDLNNNIWIGTEDAGLFRIVFADIAEEQLAATVEVTSGMLCAGESNGSLEVKVVGGKKPYKYKWSDPTLSGRAPYKVPAGKYSVTVTDKNGVETISNVAINSSEPIEISLVETQRISGPSAQDGFIEITANGGSGNLDYIWDNQKTGKKITRLAAGQYIVTVTDENGCSASKSYSVKKEKSFPTIDASQLTVGQTLRINNLYFLADSSDITDDSYEVMDEVYEFLTVNTNVVVEIGGHTNTIPSHAYCDALSAERAKNVAEYLYEKGITENRLTYKGYGKREPITQDKSLAGRRQNQRVEVKILGIE